MQCLNRIRNAHGGFLGPENFQLEQFLLDYLEKKNRFVNLKTSNTHFKTKTIARSCEMENLHCGYFGLQFKKVRINVETLRAIWTSYESKSLDNLRITHHCCKQEL